VFAQRKWLVVGSQKKISSELITILVWMKSLHFLHAHSTQTNRLISVNYAVHNIMSDRWRGRTRCISQYWRAVDWLSVLSLLLIHGASPIRSIECPNVTFRSINATSLHSDRLTKWQLSFNRYQVWLAGFSMLFAALNYIIYTSAVCAPRQKACLKRWFALDVLRFLLCIFGRFSYQ
jgi:hypothetical protein